MELLVIWVFFYWASAGAPDNIVGPFESQAKCEEVRAQEPDGVIAVSPCLAVSPDPKRIKRT